MNWLTYRTLTPEQKEEYNFRFKDDLFFNYKGLGNTVGILISMITILFFIVYLCVTSPALESYKSLISEMLVQTSKLILVTGFIIVAFCLEFVAGVVWRFYQYRKWIKENNIVVITWWSEWLRRIRER